MLLLNPYLNLEKKYEKISEEFEKLNEYQKEAILNNERVLLLNASVGSGKTTVLVNKILYLHLIKEIPLEKMFVLTFTNKAANEIKNRFKEFEITVDESNLYFGTFHSVAKKILDNSTSLEKLGYKKDFSIIDTDELTEFLNNIIDEQKLNVKYRNKLTKRIDLFKKGKPLYANMKNMDSIEKLLSIAKEEKKINNIMDFDDLIENCIKLLESELSDILPEYVIIDEFQDCNDQQINMIELLAGKTAKIFAVGDPNQTIYTWRGSRINVFKEFKDKTKAQELTLPINYRSTSTILEIAKIFLNNPSDLQGVRGNGNPIIIANHYNDFNEAIYISDKIKDLVSHEYEYKDVAILYRKQSQSKVFEDIFEKENIPFEVSVRKTLRDIPVLYWLVKLLKSSINPYDKHSYTRVLTDEKFGTLKNKKDLFFSPFKLDEKSIFLSSKIKDYKNSNIKVEDIYGYFELDKFIKPTSSDYKENKEYIHKFLKKLSEYVHVSHSEEIEGIKDFVNNSALYGTQIVEETINMTNNSVKLMTLHSAKGLEFKYVFIIGVNEGMIPMKVSSPQEEEEERRLFFVGITRAKDNLEVSYLTSPSSFGVWGFPSTYLSMIPNHLKDLSNSLEEKKKNSIRDIANEIKQERKNKIYIELQQEVTEKEEDVKIQVIHNRYGKGYIISNEDGLITINFEKYGEKVFMEGLEDFDYV